MKGKKPEGKKEENKVEAAEEIIEKEAEKNKTEELPELEAVRKECSENFEKYLRLAAEFENYKKRMQRERSDLLNYGNEKLLRDILPVMDALERALDHASDSADIEVFVQGLKLIIDQFRSALAKNGVEAIDAVGNIFDPNYHEAVLQVESKEHNQNEVVEEFEKGYLLNGRLLRPARVSVAKRVQ